MIQLLQALAYLHPASVLCSQRRVEDEVLTRLKDVLTEDELAAAIEQGKRLDLDTVVRELFKEAGR